MAFFVPPLERAAEVGNPLGAFPAPCGITAKAGTPGTDASIVRHVGRTTGQPYETPVEAFATEEGFVISLPYGADTDWLKNVLASGSATIVDQGHTHPLDQPELVPTAVAAPHLPA